MTSLDSWIDAQYRHSALGMMQSVSCGVVMERPGFGQVMHARQGSIVASPVPGAYDPQPDYFFHWYRDSAIVVDALRILQEDPGAGLDTRGRFRDFVTFSLSLGSLDGRLLNRESAWRDRAAAGFQAYLRTTTDLAAAQGDAIAAETRVNPDGTLDISRWPRPQYDGPALRALTVLRWLRSNRLEQAVRAEAETLLRADLAVILETARRECFDIWEEESGLHYYTLRVAAAALDGGARWWADRGELAASHACDTEAADILRQLDGYWLPEQRYFRSRVLESGTTSAKELDISVVLAAIHAGGRGDHTVHDVRMQATLTQLETLFDAAYAINRARPADRAPAMGRYAGDVYFSGGAYYFSTLGAAEFYFQAAIQAPAAEGRFLIQRGDMFLRTVRAYTPENGELSEQFDQQSGVQRSARHLAWSYAAFISCIAARRRARESVA
jgi:glucoamylase